MSKQLSPGTAVSIACPKCGPATQLVIRENNYTHSQFLACPNYPTCQHTQEIPESLNMQVSGQKTLFDL